MSLFGEVDYSLQSKGIALLDSGVLSRNAWNSSRLVERFLLLNCMCISCHSSIDPRE